DLHIVDGDLPRFRSFTKARLVPGHEVVGSVVQRGAAVRHLDIGDRVGVAWRHGSCGHCEQCREGFENLCSSGGVTGMTVDGGYAQFMTARASHALRIPAGLRSDEVAPLFCAGVTSYRALKNAGVEAGQRVAVFGIGGLGHLAVQIARAMGAEVIALDVGHEKLAFALELGAAEALDATDAAAIKTLRKRGGVHVALVTSAATAAYQTALQCLRPTGTLSVVGLPAEPLQIPALALVGGEIRIVGSAVGTRDDIRAVLDLAAAGLIRCRVETRPLAQINEVLDAMRQGAIRARIVVAPGG
ncbi:MAG: zinc-dependent alcohol dehydrogenase, partial [Pseudomonadota bacterium]|nr:zinc-dependent alcohol dehydrogenase [Pseudomonadota bacterium]